MRYYQVDDLELPSVTSIISEMWPKKELVNWKLAVGIKKANRISAEASSFGNACHKIVAEHLKEDHRAQLDLGIQVSDKIQLALERWKRWWRYQRLTPIALERTIWNERYAGTLDVLATDSRGRLVLLDWKFGKGVYPSYFLQMGAYYQLVRRGQEQKVFRGIIAKFHPDPKTKKEMKPEIKRFTEKQLRKHAQAFNHLYEMWLWKCQYDKMKPDGVRIRVNSRSQRQKGHKARRLFEASKDSPGN